jgi:hypothetical protein
MYYLINVHIQALLETIDQVHIENYDWLIENIHQVADIEYQRTYRVFWRMNSARLSEEYCAAYFNILQDQIENPNLDFAALVNELNIIPVNANGHRPQFSFATKMLHMVNQQLPIYDSLISAFYFFEPYCRDLPERVNEIAAFYEFLQVEYLRIQNEGFLNPSIQAFRNYFAPQHFTDAKVIDSLIWAFVDFLYDGGIFNGQVNYH